MRTPQDETPAVRAGQCKRSHLIRGYHHRERDVDCFEVLQNRRDLVQEPLRVREGVAEATRIREDADER